MKRMLQVVVGLAMVAVVGTALADHFTGTWKSETNVAGKVREGTLKLKQDGNKVTGSYVGGQNNTESPIEDASVKDDTTISFKVTREFNGQKRTTKYSGKISGDTITGKAESERDGQAQSSDWTAKRQK